MTQVKQPLFVNPHGSDGGVLADGHGTGDALGLVETTIEAGHERATARPPQ